MQERRLRLGDVLDDYCPREKRLTNHVIVALVEDEVRQTRCTTCDTEHPFKHGRVPVRRKKADASAVLYKQVLDNVTSRSSGSPDAAEPAPRVAVPPVVPSTAAPAVATTPPAAVTPSRVVEPEAVPLAAAPGASAEDAPREEPVHRHQLIRAQLPRIEGQVPERKPADFTMWHVSRHAQARGRRRDQRGPADGNVGYSPYSNGHPKAPAKPSSRPPQGQPARRNRRGGR